MRSPFVDRQLECQWAEMRAEAGRHQSACRDAVLAGRRSSFSGKLEARREPGERRISVGAAATRAGRQISLVLLSLSGYYRTCINRKSHYEWKDE